MNFFQSLINFAKQDVGKTALPILAAYLTNIADNPSGINIVAQTAKLQVDLIAAAPGIEKDLIGQIAQAIMVEATKLVAHPVAIPPALQQTAALHE